MVDIGGGDVGQQGGSFRDELRRQRLELKNLLPLDIYETMVEASHIQQTLPFHDQISPRHVREFYRGFWQVYSYVKGSVNAAKINQELIESIDEWFKLMRFNYKETELVLMGCDLFLIFVQNMQEWGIGRLFEKSIDPSFMMEDVEDDLLLLEEPDEEVIEDEVDGLDESVVEVDEGEGIPAAANGGGSIINNNNGDVGGGV
jgi:hypothetical protein